MAGLLIFVGYALYFIGWVWMIVTAIQTGKDTSDKLIWAAANFFCGIIGGIIFYVVKKQGRTPLMLQVAGIIVSIIAVVLGGGQASFNLGGMQP